MTDETQGRRSGSVWLDLTGFVVVLAAALLAFFLFPRQRSHVQAAIDKLVAEKQKGPTVEVVTAHRVTGSDQLRLMGEAHSLQTAIVYAKVSGYMQNIDVDKGDSVKANQVTAVIESPETDKQYQAAIADAHNQELIAGRAAKLVKGKVISQQAADQAEADAAVFKSELERLETLQSYKHIRAPFSGAVTARYADPGALIQDATTSQTSALPVVEISETQRLRIYVYLDQAHAAFVRTGDPVTIFFPVHSDAKVSARVTRTRGEIDPKTRTLLVEIDVDNPRTRIPAGSFVQVELKLQTPHYIDVPSDALIVKGGQPVVATITPDPVVKLRQVIVADQTGDNARLLIGLSDGERVARNFGERATKVQPVARPGS